MLPEFPEIKYGTDSENGTAYFDATLFLNDKNSNKTTNQFFVQYQVPILALCESYSKKIENIRKINEEGHQLIDGNFVYLFISFVEPQFLGYVFDRINELFIDGVCVSDTYLLQAARNRLTPAILQTIADDEQSSKP